MEFIFVIVAVGLIAVPILLRTKTKIDRQRVINSSLAKGDIEPIHSIDLSNRNITILRESGLVENINYVRPAYFVTNPDQIKLSPYLKNVTVISNGEWFSLVADQRGNLFSSGKLKAEGKYGPVKSIAAGYNHGMVVLKDGSVVSLGRNMFGCREIPENVGPIKSAAVGYDISAVVKEDGTVIAWGEDRHGISRIPEGLNNVIDIAAGEAHIVALNADGRVHAWGKNDTGQCLVPPNLHNVKAIAAGVNHSLALTSDGNVYAWGDNSYRQCKIPEYIKNAVMIAAGGNYTAILDSERTLHVSSRAIERGLLLKRVRIKVKSWDE